MLGAGRTRQGPPGSGPIILPPSLRRQKDVGAASFLWQIGRQIMQFLSLGDWFFISAATGTLLLVEVGVLIIVGVI
jgi:hypothetical protein